MEVWVPIKRKRIALCNKMIPLRIRSRVASRGNLYIEERIEILKERSSPARHANLRLPKFKICSNSNSRSLKETMRGLVAEIERLLKINSTLGVRAKIEERPTLTKDKALQYSIRLRITRRNNQIKLKEGNLSQGHGLPSL